MIALEHHQLIWLKYYETICLKQSEELVKVPRDDLFKALKNTDIMNLALF